MINYLGDGIGKMSREGTVKRTPVGQRKKNMKPCALVERRVERRVKSAMQWPTWTSKRAKLPRSRLHVRTGGVPQANAQMRLQGFNALTNHSQAPRGRFGKAAAVSASGSAWVYRHLMDGAPNSPDQTEGPTCRICWDGSSEGAGAAGAAPCTAV